MLSGNRAEFWESEYIKLMDTLPQDTRTAIQKHKEIKPLLERYNNVIGSYSPSPSELWNRAVSEVGGLANTKENFLKVSDRFKALGENAGLNPDQINKEITENYHATNRFFIIV